LDRLKLSQTQLEELGSKQATDCLQKPRLVPCDIRIVSPAASLRGPNNYTSRMLGSATLSEILQMNAKPASMFAFSRPSCKTDARCWSLAAPRVTRTLGRGSGLAVFLGIRTHSFRRLLLNA